MGGLGNDIHELELDKFIKELESEGYRVIKLNGKSPDAVAVRIKENNLEISAVEALGSQYYKNKGWKKSWTWAGKQRIYSMFDEVLIRVFKRDPNVSKSSYCNFRRCARTKIQKIEIFDNEIYFCEAHAEMFLCHTLENKSEFVYWCMANLKKSIFRILNK